MIFLACNSARAVDFESEIAPIFKENCIDCHGPDKQKGQFRLDRLSTMLTGGNSGEAAIAPGKPAESFLLKLVRHEETDLEMPPKGDPLSESEIQLIEKWIAEGAKTPDSYGPASEKTELTHWSFLPVQRSALANNIDGFIEQKLAGNGLELSPQAERRILIRRLFLVMLGIPPTPDQVDAFVHNEKADAWDSLIEEAISSPHFGERFASLWLDVVRFGETNGFETNRERLTAYPYRDWVIAAFNNDKPYDEFVRQQIAGDSFGEPIGTAFLVAGPKDVVKGKDPKLGQMQRMNELDDMINTTGTAFMGLTTGCARCHNHKFDPISQNDYYSMQAVFSGVNHGDQSLPLDESTTQKLTEVTANIAGLTAKLEQFIPSGDDSKIRPAVNPKLNVEKFPAREVKFVRFTIEETNGGQACIDELEIFSGNQNVALASTGAKATSSGDFAHPLHKLAHINDGQHGNAHSWISGKNAGWVQIELPDKTTIDRIEWARDREGNYKDRLSVGYRIESAVTPGEWSLLSSSADRSKSKMKEPAYEFTGFTEEVAAQGRAWLAQLEKAKSEKATLENTGKVWAGTFQQPGPTHRLYRGEFDAKREEVSPGAITALTSLKLPRDAPESKRRAEFATWVASPGNPLTARVIVNRLWQFHFGTGIVDTPSDFGLNGTPPSHPELLDFLASELVESGWSLKHIHRLILQSKTWQQSNRPIASAMKVDSASRLLWRFPPRRLEAEGIRDSILAVSGVLDLENREGPGFSPFEVELENVRHYHPKKSYGPEDWRRMVYMTKVRQEKDQVFGAFDCPDASQAVPKRSRSTTPLQALNLLNSTFVLQQAELLAKRLEQENKTPEAMVNRAWQLCFNRSPAEAERADSITFIKDEGLNEFTRAILNANEFVFIP